MATEPSLERLPWVSHGANCYVYEVNSLIVVKIPKLGDEERQQFRKEIQILKILSSKPSCPYLISCFYHCDKGIFLEYMRDICLSWRIQQNHTRNYKTMQVMSVEKLEPLYLRTAWMNDLTQGVAFLESLNLAHGDLRPENVLLDQDRLKLSDFDCTAEIGSIYEACIPPYGRLLGPEAESGKGTAGYLGARTELFALGSLFYLINYGFEVYDDQRLGDDPTGKDHGPTVLDLLQKMVFPELCGDLVMDNFIRKCWFNQYEKVADLAQETAKLSHLNSKSVGTEQDKLSCTEGLPTTSLPSVCEKLVEEGLLDALASYDPIQSGRNMERKYVSWDV